MLRVCGAAVCGGMAAQWFSPFGSSSTVHARGSDASSTAVDPSKGMHGDGSQWFDRPAGPPPKNPASNVEGESEEDRARRLGNRETQQRVTGKLNRRAITGKFQKYTLGEIIPITHDVTLLRFLLPSDEDVFSLRPCSTLQAYVKLGQTAMDEICRFYTPVTVNGTKGYFDVIVKRKPGGQMTSVLTGLHVGDTMMFRSVAFKVTYEANRWDNVGMIAGGTGFTPMLQVINHALRDGSVDRNGERDRTKLAMLYCNRTERHILLRGLFDRLQREYPDRFTLRYSVDAAIDPEAWTGYTGYITDEMVRDTMPPASRDGKSIVLLCGPDQLLHHAAGVPLGVGHTLSSGNRIQPVAPDLSNLNEIGGVLGRMGYEASQVYKF